MEDILIQLKGSRYCNINIGCHANFYSLNNHLKF